MMSIKRTPEQNAYLGGLIDSEGCLDSTNGTPCIRIKVTDLDIVLRAASLMDAKWHLDGYSHRREDRKDAWTVQLTGAPAIAVMLDILPWLSARRTQRVNELVLAHHLKTSPDLSLAA